jgi:hypothetical protein
MMRKITLISLPSNTQYDIPEHCARISKLLETLLANNHNDETIHVEIHEDTISVSDLQLIAEYLCESQGVDLPVVHTHIYTDNISEMYKDLYKYSDINIPESKLILENKEKSERYNLLLANKHNYHRKLNLDVKTYLKKLKNNIDFPFVASYFDIPGLVSLAAMNTCRFYNDKSSSELDSILEDQERKENVCGL